MISLIIPAHNEEERLGKCLEAVLASKLTGTLEIIVAVNGSKDATAETARQFLAKAKMLACELVVLDLDKPGKIGAIREAEAVAKGRHLAYLDADIIVEEELLQEVLNVFKENQECYVTGSIEIPEPSSIISRLYLKTWKKLPFLNENAPGAGFFALSRKGRQRWIDFPDIISDDTFVRWHFAQSERKQVTARYLWPLPEGFRNLVKARRRQDAGVKEVTAKFPELVQNSPATSYKYLPIFLQAPISFLVYSSVVIIGRMASPRGWERGR